jgi:hypothetical protein
MVRFTLPLGLPNTYLRREYRKAYEDSGVLSTSWGNDLQKVMSLAHSGHLKVQLVIGHEDDEEVVRQHNS